MTVFYLVRHGKKEAVSGDAPLSQQGLIEAHATARALGAVPIRHVYTSPLRRAKETAAPIAALHGLAVIEEARLRYSLEKGDGREWRYRGYKKLSRPTGCVVSELRTDII
jgi:broad specificity phosphatase PhoE